MRHGNRRLIRILGFIAAIVLIFGSCSTAVRAQQPLVEEFILADTVQPVTAGQLDRAIAHANSDGAAALLIKLDTPVGLVDSMRNMA